MSDEDVVIQVPDVNVIVDQQPADVLVTPVPEVAVFIENVAPSVVTLDEETDLLVLPVEDTQVVVAAGEQGPPGIPGPAGGQVIERTAGEAISALKVVYERGGLVYPLSYDDETHVFAVLGVATTSGQLGGSILVQRSGTVTDSGWNWSYDRVYLGQSGQLTQTPATDGFSVLIGFASTPTSINLSIQDPIEV